MDSVDKSSNINEGIPACKGTVANMPIVIQRVKSHSTTPNLCHYVTEFFKICHISD